MKKSLRCFTSSCIHIFAMKVFLSGASSFVKIELIIPKGSSGRIQESWN